MIAIVTISLENEMDLVLAHRRTMRVAEKMGLTIATQTTFATAVSEIARTVIEHTDNGNLVIGLEQNKQRYALKANVSFDSSIHFTNADEGFYYAQKLVPEFNLSSSLNGDNLIEMKIGLPRSLKLDPIKISLLRKYFEDEPPINAYEEIKKRNLTLNRKAEEQEEELRLSKIIDDQKTEFLSIASHEIRTPITIIKAYTQMVKSLKDQCSDKVKDILEKVDLQSTKLVLLVQQLMDVSKIETGNIEYKLEETEFNPFLEETLAGLKNILPNHSLQVSLCNNFLVNIDKLRMEQVLSNLVGNSAKYSHKNTNIHVVCGDAVDGFVTLAVKDEGIGMSAATIESIFNKFYRDKDITKTYSGLGIGLYITAKIIADHGGKIWVESTEGKGSVFYFSLPVLALP